MSSLQQPTKESRWEDMGIYWANRNIDPYKPVPNTPYEKHKVYADIKHKKNPLLNQKLCVAVFNYDGRVIELHRFSTQMFEMFSKSDNYTVTVPDLQFSVIF